jgi:hypothetical protein
MPERSRKKRRPADANRRAFEIVQEATGQKPKDEMVELVAQALREGKDPAAVLLGRKGGKKGGKVRAERMTPEERSEAARKAARARWNKNEEE